MKIKQFKYSSPEILMKNIAVFLEYLKIKNLFVNVLVFLGSQDDKKNLNTFEHLSATHNKYLNTYTRK